MTSAGVFFGAPMSNEESGTLARPIEGKAIKFLAR
jgi:hypothetical protein